MLAPVVGHLTGCVIVHNTCGTSQFHVFVIVHPPLNCFVGFPACYRLCSKCYLAVDIEWQRLTKTQITLRCSLYTGVYVTWGFISLYKVTSVVWVLSTNVMSGNSWFWIEIPFQDGKVFVFFLNSFECTDVTWNSTQPCWRLLSPVQSEQHFGCLERLYLNAIN